MKQRLSYNQDKNYYGIIIQSKQVAKDRTVLACDMLPMHKFPGRGKPKHMLTMLKPLC